MTANKTGNPDAIREGIAAGNRERERWMEKVGDGTVSVETLFSEAHKASRGDSTYALRKINLITIMDALPQWSTATANAALWHNQFEPKLKIEKLMRSREKRNRFIALAVAGSGAWNPVTFPKGWPWQGSLREVFAGKGLPEIDSLDEEGRAEDEFPSFDEFDDDWGDEGDEDQTDGSFGDFSDFPDEL